MENKLNSLLVISLLLGSSIISCLTPKKETKNLFLIEESIGVLNAYLISHYSEKEQTFTEGSQYSENIKVKLNKIFEENSKIQSTIQALIEKEIILDSEHLQKLNNSLDGFIVNLSTNLMNHQKSEFATVVSGLNIKLNSTPENINTQEICLKETLLKCHLLTVRAINFTYA